MGTAGDEHGTENAVVAEAAMASILTLFFGIHEIFLM
jgi:hypothetical protein